MEKASCLTVSSSSRSSICWKIRAPRVVYISLVGRPLISSNAVASFSTGNSGRISRRKSPAQESSSSLRLLGPMWPHLSKSCPVLQSRAWNIRFSRNCLILHGILAQTGMESQEESERIPLFFNKLSPGDFLRGHHVGRHFPCDIFIRFYE